MGIPRSFNNIIKKHLNVNAAWLPITNNYGLGDYGIISDGVFAKMGNIREFNIPFIESTGPDASIDFTSANTSIMKFAAGSEVSVIPAGAIDAKISYKFESEKSFLVKAPVIKVSEIQNLYELATKLMTIKTWGRKWKIVYQVYHALDPLIISTISSGTELTLSGNADALRNFKIADASIELGSNKELGLKTYGKAGIIALGLFRLRLKRDPGFLSIDEQKAPVTIDILTGSSPEEEDL